MPARVEEIFDKEIQSHTSAVPVSSSPSVAVRLKMLFERVQGSTARRQGAGAWRIAATSHLATIVVGLDSQQGHGLG